MINEEYILRGVCPDTLGLVAKVSNFLNEHNLFIKESAHYGDPETQKFFMRIKVISPGKNIDKSNFNNNFKNLAEEISMEWSFEDAILNPKTSIFVSKYSHCLQDLLYRQSVSGLKLDLKSVISNHPDLEKIVSDYGIPFHYVEVSKENKDEAEEKILKILNEDDVDLIILARYMQILSNDFCEKYYGKIINIHHSFLPSFKGAKPYHQAYSKGVKILGATAHYVTGELDEGPIIEQTVDRIDHTKSPEDMEIIGRDIESITLAKAVQYHSEQRVFLNNNKTVIFK
ncbi:MAG: formyltetrahydrofolate deformylase [Gammaproteobacteria bacterium]|nr:MAG: formyltetrahydrofolate deformylase [Gammaproteobacteria bacterium]|tara:strand:+ start:95 stop:952 length:858 start_codon:yes stop_codon:yes gene_type:complete